MHALFVTFVCLALLGAHGFRLPTSRRRSGLHSSTRQDRRSSESVEVHRRPSEHNSQEKGMESSSLMMICSSRQHAAVTVFSKMISRRASLASTTSVLRGGAATVMAGAVGAPKLVTWIGPALVCASSYALYNLFIKKASSSIDPILGGVVLQFVAALIGTALLLLQTVATKGGSALQITKVGLLWSVAAGCAVGAAEILSFIISGMGVEATQSIPVIVGGSIVVGTVLGAVWLRERLTIRGWLGVLMIAAGIALVGMDPGSAMGH
jgi:transporter family protein